MIGSAIVHLEGQSSGAARRFFLIIYGVLPGLFRLPVEQWFESTTDLVGGHLITMPILERVTPCRVCD